MKKTISGFEIHSTGIRKEEHPTGFKTIKLLMTIKSVDTTDEDVDKVIKLSEEMYCPVWSMLKGNVEIEVNYRIVGQFIGKL